MLSILFCFLWVISKHHGDWTSVLWGTAKPQPRTPQRWQGPEKACRQTLMPNRHRQNHRMQKWERRLLLQRKSYKSCPCPERCPGCNSTKMVPQKDGPILRRCPSSRGKRCPGLQNPRKMGALKRSLMWARSQNVPVLRAQQSKPPYFLYLGLGHFNDLRCL